MPQRRQDKGPGWGGQAVGPADLFLVVVDSQPQSCQVGDALLKGLAQALSLRLGLTVLTHVIEHGGDLTLVPAHAQQFKAIVLAERLQGNVLRLRERRSVCAVGSTRPLPATNIGP